MIVIHIVFYLDVIWWRFVGGELSSMKRGMVIGFQMVYFVLWLMITIHNINTWWLLDMTIRDVDIHINIDR